MRAWHLLVLLLSALAVCSAPVYALARPEKRVLPSGMTLLLTDNPGSEILAAELFVRAGARDEAGYPDGTASLLARVLMEDRAHLWARQDVAFLKDQTGGGLEGSSQEDLTHFTLITTRQHALDAIRLLALLMTQPQPGPELEDVRQRALQRLEADPDPLDRTRRALLPRLFPNTRMADPDAGTHTSIQAVSSNDLARFFRHYYVANNMVLSVAGDVTMADVMDTVDNWFGMVKPGPVVTHPVSPAPGPIQTEPALVECPVPVGAVGVGCRAPGVDDPQFPTLAVLNAILGGGKSSRLFHEIRDKAGIGYDVGTVAPPLLHSGYLIAYVITDATRTGPDGNEHSVLEKARSLIVQQMQEIADGKITATEVARAKRFVIGSYLLRHQRNSDLAYLAGWWEALGLGCRRDEAFPSDVEKVTREDVIRVARQSFSRVAVAVVVPDTTS